MPRPHKDMASFSRHIWCRPILGVCAIPLLNLTQWLSGHGSTRRREDKRNHDRH